MKDFTKEKLEYTRPSNLSLSYCTEFCLAALYEDKDHNVTDNIVPGLTFEELIGTLLLAKDASEYKE